ncbi:SEC-C metal-binding domain-containing protein [Klenkia terrae]
MRRFNGPMLESMMTTLRVPEDQPIESKMVSRAIRSAQTQVEQQNFETRKDVLKYDEVLNRQRTVIYDERRKVLDGEDLHEQVESMLDDVVGAYVDGATEAGYAEDWDLDQLWTGLKALYPVGLTQQELLDDHAEGDQSALTADVLKRELLADVQAQYEVREETLGSDVTRELERRVLLSVLDRKWREHLYEMDYLRAGIHLRAMANRDPVVEYQREGYDMFNAMLDGIKEESVGFLFNLEVKTKEQQEAEAKAKQDTAEAEALARAQSGNDKVLARAAAARAAELMKPAPVEDAPPAAPASAAAPAASARRSSTAAAAPAAPAAPASSTSTGTGPELAVKGLDRPQSTDELSYSAPGLDGEAETRRSGGGKGAAAKSATVTGTKAPARNAPCPCGSGKKYKQCHGVTGA